MNKDTMIQQIAEYFKNFDELKADDMMYFIN